MAFVWRDDNSLTTFRHKLPVEQQSKLTSVILKLRSKYLLKTDTNLHLDATTTTTIPATEQKDTKRDVKLAKQATKNVPMKEIIPIIDLTQLTAYFTKGKGEESIDLRFDILLRIVLAFTKYIDEILIKINGFTVFQVNKRKKVMPFMPGTGPFTRQPSMSGMLNLESFVQSEQTFTIANGLSMTLNHVAVDARVTIDEEFHNHIRRIMKKSLPPNIQIQLLFASNTVNMGELFQYVYDPFLVFFPAYC
jgi:hypothetical protein